jgi:hypothetical protein
MFEVLKWRPPSSAQTGEGFLHSGHRSVRDSEHRAGRPEAERVNLVGTRSRVVTALICNLLTLANPIRLAYGTKLCGRRHG